jgi:hypothetical protein
MRNILARGDWIWRWQVGVEFGEDAVDSGSNGEPAEDAEAA